MDFEPILAFLSAHPYGYLFLALATAGVLVPIPEDVLLLAAGFLVWRGTTELVPTMALAWLGVMVADALLFFVGRFVGRRMATGRLPWLLRRLLPTPERTRKLQGAFCRYGGFMAFGGRFMVGMRGSVFIMAGSSGMRPALFFALNGLAGLITIPGTVYLAWRFGARLDQLPELLTQGRYLVLALVGGVLIFTVARRMVRARAERRQGSPELAPVTTAEVQHTS